MTAAPARAGRALILLLRLLPELAHRPNPWGRPASGVTKPEELA